MVLAINKMDLVGYEQERVRQDRRGLPRVRRTDRHRDIVADPDFGLDGRQHHRPRSTNTPWYSGPDADGASGDGASSTSDRQQDKPFRMPVQWVNRPNLEFPRLFRDDRQRHGAAGRCGARAAFGQEPRLSPRIVTLDGDLEKAVAGQSVTLTLADEIDCSRGDVMAQADTPPEVADQFEATIVWMAEERHAARAAILAEDRHADGDGAGHGAEVPGQRQHDGASGRPRRWSSTPSACRRLARSADGVRAVRRTTATSAGSS